MVGADDWQLPTPCPGWDVRTLVAHVVLGEAMAAGLFSGAEAEPPAEVDTSVLGPHPVATWRGTAVAALEAASGEGAMEATYHHPAGVFPGAVIVGLRVTDNLVHAWDLARACGRGLELPEGLAERCLDFWEPVAGSGGTGEHFGAPLMPPEGAPAGVRLLALLGREA